MRHAGVKLVDQPTPVAITQTFNHVLVGGSPISFTGETLRMGGKDYSPEGWLELRRRIDRAYIHGGYIEEVGIAKAPWEGRSCGLLERLAVRILTSNRKRRWWLRWLL